MDIGYIIKEINDLKNKSAEELAQQYLSEKAREETDFPFVLNKIAAHEIGETAVIQPLTGPGHYLVVYTASEVSGYTVGNESITLGAFDTRAQYKEIDLFYKPGTGAAQKVFGLGRYAVPTENGITISAPDNGAAACLIFLVGLNETLEATGLEALEPDTEDSGEDEV